MLSSVTSNHSQNVYSPGDVGGPDPFRSPSRGSDGSAPPVSPAGDGSDLPLPRTTGSLSQRNILELGFAIDSMQTGMEDAMRLFYVWASETRQSQKAVRHSELNAQVEVLLKAAQKLRDAADANFKAAIVSGVMGIVGGALNIGCNVGALRGAYKSIKYDNLAANPPKPDRTTKVHPENSIAKPVNYGELSRMANARSTALPGIGMGMSQSVTSLGEIIAAGFKREADRATADAKQLDALATARQALSEHANEWVREMQDLMQDTLQKMSALIQIQHDTNSRILS